MHQGKINGYFCQGFNPLMSFPNRGKLATAMAKLKFLVVMDPLATETSEFWQNHGEHNNVDPAKIQTEVFRLPTTVFAEEDGSLTNSGRWLQWHWKGAEPPAEAITDIEIMAKIFLKVRELYQKEGGAYADPILNLTWDYEKPQHPSAEELARELNGRALADVPDPRDSTRLLLRRGQQLAGFGELRNDGTTMGGCWIYSGCWTEAGNQMARRDNSDPGGLGLTPRWAWSWPANRRILYNRASADVKGAPFNPKQKQVWWNGERWIMDMCACRPSVRAGAAPGDACSCDEACLCLEDGATCSNILLSEVLTASTCDVVWLLDECLRGLLRTCTLTGFLTGFLRCSCNFKHSVCASG